MSSTRLGDPVREPFSGSAHDLEDSTADIPYILALCERLLDHLDHINEDPDVLDEARRYLFNVRKDPEPNGHGKRVLGRCLSRIRAAFASVTIEEPLD